MSERRVEKIQSELILVCGTVRRTHTWQTFLVWTNPMATPFSIHRGFFQGVRAVTQAWFTLICKRPWRHALCGTCGFNQRWRGRMRSRPSCNTGDAAAIRPSILWNTLSGRAVSLLKVAASFWMARARSGAITALMWAESRTVPRNDIRWLGDSALLAKLTLSPRRSKWLRMRVLCESSSTSDWARMSQSSRVVENADSHLSQRGKSRVHALRKSTGGQRQPKG